MKLYIYLFLIMVFGCGTKTNSIEFFFRELNRKLSKNEKSQIKECPDIGCLGKIVHFKMQKEFSDAYKLNAAGIDRLLIDSFKMPILNDRLNALIVAYNRKLNGKEIDFWEIKKSLADYYKFQDSLYSNKNIEEIQYHTTIAKKNFESFDIGDTLNSLLPLEMDGSIKVVYYYSHYDKNNFKDTLFIKGVLLKKTKESAEEFKFAHDEYNFSIRIIDLNNRELNLIEKKYQKGNIITIPLYDFGRLIEK